MPEKERRKEREREEKTEHRIRKLPEKQRRAAVHEAPPPLPLPSLSAVSITGGEAGGG